MTDSTQPSDRRALLQNALRAIDDLQAKLDAVERARTEPIAIVGLSCRFPGGANDPEAYWQLLRDGRDVVGPAPTNRWNMADFADQGIAWYGGFLDEIDGFDPKFFGITPREAASMDPQQRLVLEVSWEALERAGIAPDRLNGSLTGMFLGVTTNDYAQLAKQGGPQQLDVYTATGTALNAAAGRVAYTLGLQGPCMSIDTACSSSLVALHLACQSLRSGESDLALAGGVNAILTPDAFVCFSKWGMMAPDGRCKTFDAHADGFVRAEGCGVIVLKRLSDAVANGDNILAVIRGSAVNQDGRSSGLTVPNGLAQQAVIRRALANAGLSPNAVSYVETHGTGTALGDPIEVEALGAALGPGRDDDHPLTIGSVKTNLGHLESASGMAGLIKVVLSLQHEALPPHLHLQERSPRIPWPNFPIEIPASITPWPRSDRRRIAGVSGFGFSGTNAHVIVEEAPIDPRAAGAGAMIDRPVHLLTLSAKTEPALQQLADRFAQHPIDPLADMAYTANTGRARFAHRLALIATSGEEAREKLTAFARGQSEASVIAGQVNSRPKIAFLFTGQGAQYAGMGRQLYDTQPTFRAALDRCDEILRPYLGLSVLSVLYPDSATPALHHAQRGASVSNQHSAIDQTALTQPALFAVEYALAELWKSWGVRPTAVMGHSVGEYVAACVAGVLSLEDGLRLIAERGRLMQALPQNGDMVAVFADEGTVSAAIEPFRATVSIAAINGPENVVVSGLRTDVQTVIDQLTARGIQSRRLTVSHAFHSPLMQQILDPFAQTAATIQFAAPQIDLISNVTGRRATSEVMSAAYWRQHILAPVQFAASMQTLQQQGYTAFVEIGPNPTLLGMAHRCLPESEALRLPSLRSSREDWAQVLESLGTLYVNGADVDWAGFDRDYAPLRRRVMLPTYPFERQRYWLEQTDWLRPSAARQHPLLGDHISLAHTADVHVWEGEINTQMLPYLDDHRVQDVPVVPATAYMEMVMAAAAQAFDAQSFALTDMKFHKPITLPEGASPAVQVVLSQADGQSVSAQIFSRSSADASWTLHATGQLNYDSGIEVRHWESAEIEAIKARCHEELSGEEFYRLSSAKGNQWGAAFQGVQRVWRGDREALSLVQVPAALQPGLERYVFHPAISDACGHVLTATISLDKSAADKGGAFVGGSVDETRVYARPRGHQFWAYARLRPDTEQQSNILIGDVQVIDENGTIISETLGAHLWYLDKSAQRALSESIDDWFYDIQWEPAARATAQPIAHAPGTWLILSDRGGVSEQLVTALRARGDRAICVTASDTYERTGEDQYCIRPDQADDLHRLVKNILGADRAAWRGVVHLWSLDAPTLTGRESLDSALTLNAVSVLHLIQTLAPIEWQEFPRIWLITRSAQSIGASPVALAQTPVWGLGRTLALEHSELWGGLIDLDAAATPGEVANDLLSEIVDRSREDQIAFRGGQRYVARLAHHTRSATNAPAFQLRADASYLITGGLGGLGLQVGRWLSERGTRHVILMGRTPLPPRAEWDQAAAGSQTAQQIAAIQTIEASGATVHLAAVDVADEAQLRSFVAAYQAEGHPAIRGVVHAAGILRHNSLIDCAAVELQAVLRAKVAGGWHLQQLLGDQLDFFVTFSSASALLSSPRLGSYAAANAFLDGLAHYRHAHNQPALSVNWGVWADEGMAAQFNRDDVAMMALRGMGTLSTWQGLEALQNLMQQAAAQHATQVGVLPVNWRRWQELYPAFVDAPFLTHVVQRPKQTAAPRPPGLTRDRLLAAGPDEQPTLLQSYLNSLAAKTMGVSNLDSHQPLNELGLDSLMAVEMKNRIETDLGVVVPMVRLLQGPSIAQLAAHVLAQVATLEPATAPKPTSAAKTEDQPAAQQLLAQLDQLSDDQVDALLTDLLIAGGQPDE